MYLGSHFNHPVVFIFLAFAEPQGARRETVTLPLQADFSSFVEAQPRV